MPDPRHVGILIPVYDNPATIADIVRRSSATGLPVLVVNDGSTDATTRILADLARSGLRVLHHERNKGKGEAIKTGLREANRLGWTHAVTIDADGQHHPEDVPLLLRGLDPAEPNPVRIGWRHTMAADANVPRRCRFGRFCSNLAFRLLTGRALRDTQSGFRLYPVALAAALAVPTSRYDAEFELLVALSRAGCRIEEIPIRVHYPPRAERISHFRPFGDALRIALCALRLFANPCTGRRSAKPRIAKEAHGQALRA